MFAVGNCYFYIVNLHNFELEYVSDSVKRFVDKEKSNLKIQDLLQSILPEELEIINLKSRLINDFYTSFLTREEVLDYKNMFTYRMEDPQGRVKTMLYQAMPLSVLENGSPEHVFCLQTDISYMKVPSTRDVSFINMHGGKSYFNVDISHGKFDLSIIQNGRKDLSELFSVREIEIINELAGGLNAEGIAEKLYLSPHTVKTHRKNILQKSGCANTTELVAKCLTGGVIAVGLS